MHYSFGQIDKTIDYRSNSNRTTHFAHGCYMSRPFLKANPTNYSKLQLEVRPLSFVEGLWQNEPSSNPNLKPEVTEQSQISQFQNPTQSEQEL